MGWSSGDAVGRDVRELIDFVPEQGEAPARLSLKGLLESAHPLTGHLRARSGERRMLSLQAAPLKGPGEATTGTVLVLRDIGIEREVTHQRLRHQKLESLGLLAGGIAHDFNNILAGILGIFRLPESKARRARTPTICSTKRRKPASGRKA